MKITLEKASGKCKCRGLDCQRNPDFISKGNRIKKDTVCAAIQAQSGVGWNTSYYCRECITKLYQDIKKVLNPDLWIFQ